MSILRPSGWSGQDILLFTVTFTVAAVFGVPSTALLILAILIELHLFRSGFGED